MRSPNAIKSKVPPIADKALAGLVAKPLNTAHPRRRHRRSPSTPTKIALIADELFVGIDTKLRIDRRRRRHVAHHADVGLAASMGQTQRPRRRARRRCRQTSCSPVCGPPTRSTCRSTIDAIPALGALLDDDARTMDAQARAAADRVDRPASSSSRSATRSSRSRRGRRRGPQIALSVRTTLAAEPSQAGNILLTVGSPEGLRAGARAERRGRRAADRRAGRSTRDRPRGASSA